MAPGIRRGPPRGACPEDRPGRRGADLLTDLGVTRLTTTAPTPFDFAGTARSHGWAVLDPNRWDHEARELRRTERLGPGRAVHLRVAEGGSADRPRVRVHVTHDGELTPGEAASLRSGVRRMLRLDEDLAPFHALCRRIGGRWRGVAEAGLGRLLRSPTVFEDAVKTICTTNVRWGGTKAMVGRLVQSLGEPGPLSGDRPAGHPNAFPTPLRIAAADGRTLGEARLGYRAPYVRALSERIASGELDLEELHGSDASTDEVRRLLCDIKGIGPYAAATLLMLLGRYGDVAIDSVYRSFVRRRYFRDREPSSEELESVYRHWGKWKHLGYWFDLWHDTEVT